MGSEMCIRDRPNQVPLDQPQEHEHEHGNPDFSGHKSFVRLTFRFCFCSAYQVQYESFGLSHLKEQDLKRMRDKVDEWRCLMNAETARPPVW